MLLHCLYNVYMETKNLSVPDIIFCHVLSYPIFLNLYVPIKMSSQEQVVFIKEN